MDEGVARAGAIYDQIGRTYASTRRPDPRIEAAIRSALGDAGSVVNVGAGTGSYEPPQTVLAVEPSSAMIAQRPEGAAPAVQARPSGSRCRTARATPPWRCSPSTTGPIRPAGCPRCGGPPAVS